MSLLLGLEVLQLAVSHWEMALDRLEDMEYVVSGGPGCTSGSLVPRSLTTHHWKVKFDKLCPSSTVTKGRQSFLCYELIDFV